LSVRCSIVIPVHGRAGLTRQCLDAIIAEPPQVDHELIVVDDASPDDTGEALESYQGAVRVVTRRENGGFARACNDGAAAGTGEYLVFLNNDTIPVAEWLDALVAVADREPDVSVVGSKLLFPNDTVQHAGVAICQDGHPRHIYAGFPADHPAVTRHRRFQAVTAASMLVRRTAFEHAAGFDPAFRNCLEDADLCLRLGEHGHEIAYCPDSVVYHLESVSRGRRSDEIGESGRVFHERWDSKIERDDLRLYMEDGLLRIHYRDLYPLSVEIAPELAVAAGGDLSSFVQLQSNQVADLLRETVRLTAHAADIELADVEEHGAPRPPVGNDLLADAERLQLDIHAFQESVAAAIAQGGGSNGVPPFTVGNRLSHLELTERVRVVVEAVVPSGAAVLVVSRGDERLLELGDRSTSHFPQEDDGTYAGRHPDDSDEAIGMLEQMRERGAGYLVIPDTDAWWLEHYADLARHLDAHYRLLTQPGSGCSVFGLQEAGTR
jgi:GT2 family glycosyltransferase